jgi:hypothetical protein
MNQRCYGFLFSSSENNPRDSAKTDSTVHSSLGSNRSIDFIAFALGQRLRSLRRPLFQNRPEPRSTLQFSLDAFFPSPRL